MPTTEYTVCDWEQNGYHDSYFHALYWSPESGFRSEEIGATAYGGGSYRADLIAHPAVPADLMPAMYEALAEIICSRNMAAQLRDIMEPETAPAGWGMRTLAAGRWTDKKTGTKVEWAAGDPCRVFWAKAFGTFYSNGYNRPGRANISCGVEFNDGRRAFIPLKKLRRDAEPTAQDVALEQARALARRCDPGQVFGAAWSSEVYARAA